MQREDEVVRNAPQVGKVNETLRLVIFFSVILVVVLAIFGGRSLFSPSTGWGSWSREVFGPCIPVEEGSCNGRGMQWSTSICIPNSNTGRGCLDEGGMQTFAPRRVKKECKYLCYSSKWEIEKSECKPPQNPCASSTRVAGSRSVKMECVPTGLSGAGKCVRRVTESEGEGTVRKFKSYKVGDVVEWEESCYSYQRPECPVWYSEVPSEVQTEQVTGQNSEMQLASLKEEMFTRIRAVDGGGRMEGVYIPSRYCETGDEDRFAVLEEGILTLPLKCGVIRGGDAGAAAEVITPDVAAQECPVVAPGANIECEGRRIQAWQMRSGAVPSNFNNLACPGVYSERPALLLPCRYLPAVTHQYQRGADFDLLLSSLLLLFTTEGRLLVPEELPQITPLLRARNNFTSSRRSASNSIPILALDPGMLENRGCTPEKIAFNTGILALIAPRSLMYQGPAAVVNIAILISLSHRGWLGSSSTGAKNIVWEQASAGPRDPGITTANSERYIITLETPVQRDNLGTFHTECSGAATLSISREDRSALQVKLLGGRSSGNLVPLSRLKVFLFPRDTELCSRAVQGPESCNLLNRKLEPTEFQGCVA